MNSAAVEAFTSRFVLPDEVAGPTRVRIPQAEDGLHRLDDLMVVLEGLGGSYPPPRKPVMWSVVRL